MADGLLGCVPRTRLSVMCVFPRTECPVHPVRVQTHRTAPEVSPFLPFSLLFLRNLISYYYFLAVSDRNPKKQLLRQDRSCFVRQKKTGKEESKAGQGPGFSLPVAPPALVRGFPLMVQQGCRSSSHPIHLLARGREEGIKYVLFLFKNIS